MKTPARSFYWGDSTGSGRNVFCIFRRQFELDGSVRLAEIHLFADSLYRLRVNGAIVGHGPARFVPSHPEFDTYDIHAFLRPGSNEVVVEANSRGVKCYQAVLGSGAVAVWGQIVTYAPGREESVISLDMPADWISARDGSWDRNAEKFSFAQGPVEIRDLTVPVPTMWGPPVEVSSERFGSLRPRSIPMPSERFVEPKTVVIAAPLQDHHHREGFRFPVEFDGGRIPFFTHIHSPEDQEVDLGVFWGPSFLDGVELDHRKCDLRGNRENVRVRLTPGWHFFFGYPEILAPGWAWLLDFPTDRGISMRALPDADCRHAFFHRESADFFEDSLQAMRAHPPASLTDLEGFPAEWQGTPLGGSPSSPAREMAWDLACPPVVSDASWREPLQIPMGEGREGTVVLDFWEEFLGHACFEIEAPAGTLVDVGYDERLNGDRMIGFYQCNHLVNAADRMILPGGRQRIEMFHERGGRYLQLTFRHASAPVTLYAVGVRSSLADYTIEGKFRCGDEIFDWTWDVGVATQLSSMVDGWVDPWRERGLYLGDALVEAHCTGKFTRDRRLEKWCLRLWAHAQRADGQMPDVVPSDREYCLNDYSLLWVQLLWNYWAATGDVGLVAELWESVGRILKSPVWKEDSHGLWEVTETMRLFVDWGVVELPEARSGSNAILNAYRIRALECASGLAAVLGFGDESAEYASEERRVRRMFCEFLWDASHNRFAACLLNGRTSSVTSLHANALALAYGIATPSQVPAVLKYLEAGLSIDPDDPPAGTPELYFLYFVLDAFYKNGETKAAEELILNVYGKIRERGAWRLPETFSRYQSNLGSMCHGWSAAPMVFFSERILGVRFAEAGDPRTMLVVPESECLDRASGTVPHPFGLIHVSWAVYCGELQVNVTLPRGVRCIIQPAGRLALLPLQASVNGEKMSNGIPVPG